MTIFTASYVITALSEAGNGKQNVSVRPVEQPNAFASTLFVVDAPVAPAAPFALGETLTITVDR